jgi:hypothetical protein
VKRQRFGVEIELDGLDVDAADRVVRDYFEGSFDHLGRMWTVVADASIPTGFELVTPPIFYADLYTLQELFRRLRRAGARRSAVAGLHVHVDANDYAAQQIRSLVNIYASHAQLILLSFNVQPARRVLFAQSVEPFARIAESRSVNTREELQDLWYEVADAEMEGVTRYNSSRYTELNLNSYFYRGTIEFRTFNATNHSGRLRAAILLALALADAAKTYPNVYPLRPLQPANEADAFTQARALFQSLGLDSPEFRRTRGYLEGNLRRHFRRVRTPTKRSVAFRSRLTSFDGGSFAEVLDEMADAGFFDADEVQPFLARLRKERGTDKDKLWARRLTVSDRSLEAYAETLLSFMVEVGLGQLTVIG